MALALILLTFLFTLILVVAVGSLIVYRRALVEERLSGIGRMSVDSAPEDILRLPFMQRVVAPALFGMGRFFGRVAPQEIRSRVDKRIIYAGVPWNLNFFSLFALQVLLGGSLLLLSVYLTRILQVSGFNMLFFVAVVTLIGFFLPYAVVSSKAETRQQKIRRSLPDVLDLLLVSVEAGLGFDMAMKKVASQMPGPLSTEIKRSLDEIRMGAEREVSLRGIALRSGVTELSSFISSVIQSEQLGSNIAKTLRVQADFMRAKRRQRAQEMAMKAPVKMVFPLVLFIFPALFVVIVGPAAITIYRNIIMGL